MAKNKQISIFDADNMVGDVYHAINRIMTNINRDEQDKAYAHLYNALIGLEGVHTEINAYLNSLK